MKVVQTEITGVYVIKPHVFRDDRGFFMESYSLRDFKKHGIDCHFVQDNHARSEQKGVLRGLHFQNPPQAKLVRVVVGSIYDVVVDLRKESSTFGKYFGITLSADNFCMLFAPVGLAHGYCVLSDVAEVLYKADEFYTPEGESGLLWNDEDVAVPWPVQNPILSEKDQDLPRLCDLQSPF